MFGSNFGLKETIFSLVSGVLPSAVAIVRISGPNAFPIGQKIFFGRNKTVLEKVPGMRIGSIWDENNKKVDDVLLLAFISPHSFTGEDVIEFHCHGAIPIIETLQNILVRHGARPAQKGEFSYRAFLNNKMVIGDLELLGDLYFARDRIDLDSIYARKDGSVEYFIAQLRAKFIDIQAIFDTAVDFSEEYSSVINESKQIVIEAIRDCRMTIQRYSLFMQGGTVPRLVISGSPNAGKSSLFNALLGRYRVVVHSDPGTTRDVIEEDVGVGGRHWKIVDTAGIREAENLVERDGLVIGKNFLEASSFFILVVDGTKGISTADLELMKNYGDRPSLVAWNKKDLPGWKPCVEKWSPETVLSVSAKTGDGIVDLWEVLNGEMARVYDESDKAVPLPSATQVAKLNTALNGMIDLLENVDNGQPPELLAEKNRWLIRLLEDVIGEVKTEEVLGSIFSRFCIGK